VRRDSGFNDLKKNHIQHDSGYICAFTAPALSSSAPWLKLMTHWPETGASHLVPETMTHFASK